VEHRVHEKAQAPLVHCMLPRVRVLFSVRRLRYLRNGVLTTVPMLQQSRYSTKNFEANDAGLSAAGNHSSNNNKRAGPFNRAQPRRGFATALWPFRRQRAGSRVTTRAPGMVSRRVGTNWVPA
jgi:hypothetical protein